MRVHRFPFFIYVLALIYSVSVGVAVADLEPAEEENTGNEKKFYKKVGPDGKVIYTDKADESAKEIKVPKAATYKPVKTPRFTPYQIKKKPKPATAYDTFTITKPMNDSTNRTNQGTLPVSIELKPALKSGHKIAYLLDGKVVAENSLTRYTLTEVHPGTHKVTVEIRDYKGSVIQSNSATFHQKRFLIRR